MPISGPLTEEQQRQVEEAIRRKKEAAMGVLGIPSAGAPEDLSMEAPDPLNAIEAPDPLDAIVQRKQRPDPMAEYNARIQEATDATPNIGQMIGAGFAGYGQALAGGQGGYLDKTLKGIDDGRLRGIESAKLAKTQFEEKDERDPNSELSREFQMTAAEMTGRKPEELAGMSAYEIKKVLPTLESRYKIKTRAEERISEDRYRQDMINATRDNRIAERGAKAEEKAAKAEQELAGRTIPGFNSNPKVQAPLPAVEKMREGMAAWETFTQGLDDYQKLIESRGTGEFWDEDAAGRMQQLATDLQLTVKKLAQLGVLSKSDEPFIKKQIPDPSWFAREGKMQATLQSAKEGFTRDMLANLRARGYEPDEEFMKRLATPSGPGAKTPPPAAPVTQYDDPEKERRYQEWKASQRR